MHPARTSTTNIQLLRSSVDHKRPAAGSLLDGQVAVNTSAESTSSGLYFKLSNGTLTKIGPVAVSAGVAPNAIPVGSSGNAIGETWLDLRSAYASPILKVFDGTYWQIASGFTVNEGSGDFSLNRQMRLINLDTNGTGSQSWLRLPRDNSTARANIDARSGMIRFNSESEYFEGYDGHDWSFFASLTKDADFANLTVSGYLDVKGNVSLGSGCGNTVTIDASSTIKCDLDVRGSLNVDLDAAILGQAIQLGSGSSGLMTCLASASFEADVEAKQDVSFGSSSLNLFECVSSSVFRGSVTMDSNVTIGKNSADSLRVESTSSFYGPSEFRGKSTFKAESTFDAVSTHNEDVLPGSDSAYNLGSRTRRWANVYTGDLHLQNDRGDWTVIEEENYLSLRQNATGKVFKILMQEVEG